MWWSVKGKGCRGSPGLLGSDDGEEGGEKGVGGEVGGRAVGGGGVGGEGKGGGEVWGGRGDHRRRQGGEGVSGILVYLVMYCLWVGALLASSALTAPLPAVKLTGLNRTPGM